VTNTPTPQGHRRGRSAQSSLNSMEIRLGLHTDRAEAALDVVNELEQALRRMQADDGLNDSRNAACHEAMRADNFAELIVPARLFIPTTTPEQHRAQYDALL
jgi:hypothetical protein